MIDAKNKRHILGAALACTTVALLARGAGAFSPSKPADDRPNFLVIVVDDWALKDLELARSDNKAWNDLPTIDALQRQSLSFRNFYTQPLCAPSRATLIFGSYRGDTIGTCVDASTPRSIPSVTIATMLQDRGYATGAFGKWHVGPHPDPDGRWEDAPGAYGFDTWRAINGSNFGGHCSSKNYSDWYRVDDGVGTPSIEYHTTAVADAAAKWWSETTEPKFGYVAFQAAHAPFHAPPDKLLPSDTPKLQSKRLKYEAMLVAMDGAIASLLKVVDREDTYVFLFGDNGTPWDAVQRPAQHSARAKKTTFEDGVNVPCLVAGPGITRSETNTLGHIVDLMATLAELSGASVPPGSDSVSLAPVLSDPGARIRNHVICEATGEVDGKPWRDVAVILDAGEHGLVKGRWFRDEGSRLRTRRFYALALDPRETDALDPARPLFVDAIKRVQAIHDEYIAR